MEILITVLALAPFILSIITLCLAIRYAKNNEKPIQLDRSIVAMYPPVLHQKAPTVSISSPISSPTWYYLFITDFTKHERRVVYKMIIAPDHLKHEQKIIWTINHMQNRKDESLKIYINSGISTYQQEQIGFLRSSMSAYLQKRRVYRNLWRRRMKPYFELNKAARIKMSLPRDGKVYLTGCNK